MDQRKRLKVIAQAHRPLEKKKISLLGFDLIVYPQVFSPNGTSTSIFKDILLKNKTNYKSVLEIGCGSGILSLILSKKAQKVLATDINDNALKSARENMKVNKIGNIEIRKSDLFKNISEKFDLIIFNPPWMSLKPQSPIELALTDYNHTKLKEFFEGAPKHLNINGKIIIDFSDMGDGELLEKLIKKAGMKVKKLYSTRVKDLAGIDTEVYILELSLI